MHLRRTLAAAMAVVLALGHAAVGQEGGQQGGEPAADDVTTRTVSYEFDGMTFEGYLAQPADVQGQAPGVLVVHEWWGLNDYAKRRARQLAELGYVAFAADMYGQGRSTDDPAQARQWAGKVSGDRGRMRARAQAALGVLREQENVAGDRLAAIGYCFGGTSVLELAYANPEGLQGVVSFHGSPKPPMKSDAPIEPSILILHGAADPTVSDQQLDQVTQGLSEAGADWVLVKYAGAKHAFTNPASDERAMDAVGYDAKADERSWEHMRVFLEEQLRGEAASGDQAQ